MRPRGTPPTRDAGPRVTRACPRAWHFARALGWFALALGMVASCGSTIDSLGYDDAAGLPLGPLKKKSSYPNPFRERGHSDADITNKINLAFASLFHGDLNHTIYVSDGTDAEGNDLAHILDVFHNDVRTEGIGLGMLIAVELDHRDELDALWRFTKAMLRVQSGSRSGYFNSFCENAVQIPVPCLDPFGLQQMTMALILAHDRYGDPPPTATNVIDYAADAKDLLTLMRHKVDQNGGVKDGVTDTFDHATSLVYDQPLTMYADVGRPSIEMPGYYDLWAQATGDPFWTMAAKAGRDYWRRTTDTNPTTGLIPVRATFAGVPLAGMDGVFASEAYRAQISMTQDQIWTDGNDWNPGEADRLLGFFTSQGLMTYGMTFSLDGTMVLNTQHDPALEAANGVSAAIATNTTQSAPFVDVVWSMPIPSGANRYFSGLLYLVSLLVLGGQMQVL